MNAQRIISKVSRHIREDLSAARFDQSFLLTIDVTVKIEGETNPIILHETLVNSRKRVKREDDIEEIVGRRIRSMISKISGRYVSGEYIPNSKVKVKSVDYVLV